MFLLDTDHVVILQRQPGDLRERLLARLSEWPRHVVFISIVSFHEQVAGWQALLNRPRNSESVAHAYNEFTRLLTLYSDSQLSEFDQVAADHFELLRQQGVRIGTMDLRIAATALVLTRNLVDFEEVPGLKVEDWTVVAPEKPR